MNAVAKPLTVDDFIAWSLQQSSGRYELMHGEIIAMASERMIHRRVKNLVANALEAAARSANIQCHVEPDGATVRIDDDTAFEPDSLVYLGALVALDSVEVPAPVIVVEVVSPSMGRIDSTAKLLGYFLVASIEHYLILDGEKRKIVHHRRTADGSIHTTIHSSGELILDPPGLTLPVAAYFPPATAT